MSQGLRRGNLYLTFGDPRVIEKLRLASVESTRGEKKN